MLFRPAVATSVATAPHPVTTRVAHGSDSRRLEPGEKLPAVQHPSADPARILCREQHGRLPHQLGRLDVLRGNRGPAARERTRDLGMGL